MAKVAPNPEEQMLNPGDVTALTRMTHIDRRHAKRVVPMKVLALGNSRTGTASLRQALIDLGYKDCYHYSVPLQENPLDRRLWIEAMEAQFEGKGKRYTRVEFDSLLGHCQAVTDGPCIVFYKQLLELYPEAKVILTVRDSADQWWTSAMETIMQYWSAFIAPPTRPLDRFYRMFVPMEPDLVRMSQLQFHNHPVYSALGRDLVNGTQEAKAVYEAYNEEIKHLVPQERLLVMNVKEGWEPLCKFLGEEVLLYPIPRKNETKLFKKVLVDTDAMLKAGARLNIAKMVGTFLVAGVAFAVAAHRFRLLEKYQLFRK